MPLHTSRRPHRISAGRTCLFIAMALACSGCTAMRDFQERWQISAERKLSTGKLARYKAQHAAFRSQPGWRKLTYRQPDLMANAKSDNTSVEISLREQRGLLLVDGAIAMDFPVATGKSSHPTPKGSYKIVEKKEDHCSNLYGRIVSASGDTVVSDADTRDDAIPEGGSFVGARMPYWMRISPAGIGMHVGHVPGSRPASHGCIRLKKDTAVELFGILGLGTPVAVASFAPVLGGPVGHESVVIGEVAEKPERPHRKPKPVATPAPATEAAPAEVAATPPSTPTVPSQSTPAPSPAN
ncbi:MAG: L,D-transpeptidase [Chthoniobacterales bacterium]|nr:L,D-transpeptidase [Chthoniobacterales bacterium]